MLHSTTSTSIIYNSYVGKSFALLKYKNILETAGMFSCRTSISIVTPA
jgi:hypothetical protein